LGLRQPRRLAAAHRRALADQRRGSTGPGDGAALPAAARCRPGPQGPGWRSGGGSSPGRGDAGLTAGATCGAGDLAQFVNERLRTERTMITRPHSPKRRALLSFILALTLLAGCSSASENASLTVNRNGGDFDVYLDGKMV